MQNLFIPRQLSPLHLKVVSFSYGINNVFGKTIKYTEEKWMGDGFLGNYSSQAGSKCPHCSFLVLIFLLFPTSFQFYCIYLKIQSSAFRSIVKLLMASFWSTIFHVLPSLIDPSFYFMVSVLRNYTISWLMLTSLVLMHIIIFLFNRPSFTLIYPL